MRMRILYVLTALLISAMIHAAPAGANSNPEPEQLLLNLLEVNKSPVDYAMKGRFILKATGEEIEYRAQYARGSGQWAADFSHPNSSRNIRYVSSGGQAWISSPEITLDAPSEGLPYMARYDFFVLYDDLIRILQNGEKDPRFGLENAGSEIHVYGKLENGWEAAFVLNAESLFPRKVLINMMRDPAPSWLFTCSEPDGSGYTAVPSHLATEFEIWFSDPLEADNHRFSRRTDFVENGSVIGTLFLEEITPLEDTTGLFVRPARFPWAGGLNFKSRTQWPESPLYLHASSIQALRNRTREEPWAGWIRLSGRIAQGARLMIWLSRIIPGDVSFKTFASAVAIGFPCFLFLLVRRRDRWNRRFSWKLAFAGALAACILLGAESVSLQLRSPVNRSLLALHAALRYAVSGDAFYAATSMDLLDGLDRAPARSMEELGRSSQAYALAYDLVREELPKSERTILENRLFDNAKPLFGALQGWNSNTNGSAAIAAGLGMTGLAVDFEPFVETAEETMRRTLETQLSGGFYRAGPGQGVLAMDSAVNFFYGLKQAGREDFFSHPAFRDYIESTLRMISPEGTLPLFGDTSLDQSARLGMLLLKTADHLPEDTARQCAAACERYRDYGQLRASGWRRLIQPAWSRITAYYDNPFILLQHKQSVAAGDLPSGSAVIGNGQAAVLRTGNAPDSLYLALNVPKSGPDYLRRDILTFDLYAYGSLMLHGAGYPGKDHPRIREAEKTSAGNSITINGESQAAVCSSGVETSLLNCPLFDYVRASADKTYNYGQVQRDIVMVRPEENRLGYFLLIDTVRTGNPETSVQWHLHGGDNLATGLGQGGRWAGLTFDSSGRSPDRVTLEVAFPTGSMGNQSTGSGILFSETPSLNRKSKSITIEWFGSRRFATLLFPSTTEEAPKTETVGDNSGKIGDTDWISIGSLDSTLNTGSLTHRSELTFVRDRGRGFPAILMISGIGFQFGPHSLISTKPLSASMDGLRGGITNPRPDTQVEIRSPAIRQGDAFLLDDIAFKAVESGKLTIELQDTGEHDFRPSD